MKALLVLAVMALATQRQLLGVVRLVGSGENPATPIAFPAPSEQTAELLRSLSRDEIEVVAGEEGAEAAARSRHVKELFGSTSPAVSSFSSLNSTFHSERECSRLLVDRFNASSYALDSHELSLWERLGEGAPPSHDELARVHEQLITEGGDEVKIRAAASLRASIAFNLHERFGSARNLSFAHSPRRRVTRLTSFTAHDALRYETFPLLDLLLDRLRALATNASTPRFTLLVGPAARLLDVLAAFHMSSAACIAATEEEGPLCRFFPAPGSVLDLELFRGEKGLVVRALYNGEETSLCPSDAVWCPWPEFEVSLDETMKSDFPHYCANGEKLIFSPGRMIRRKLGRLLCVIGAVLLVLALKRRWPELANRRPTWSRGLLPPAPAKPKSD